MFASLLAYLKDVPLLAIPILTLAGLAALSTLAHHYTLNIKSKEVGHGQHGTACFASKREIAKTYTSVPFQVSDWRKGTNLPTTQGLVVGCKGKTNQVSGLVDSGDVHCLMIGAAGVGKTAFFLYPNLEYACASGMSFITTDTKGDLFRNYAGIAKKYYGYHIAVIDLRNPTRSDGNNLLHLVNKYMDIARNDPNDIASKATAEKYAKIISKTIIGSDSGNYGQNAFFYDAAEGLLTSVILLLSEYMPPEEVNGHKVDTRHIVSVFKLVQELMQPPATGGSKGKNSFQLLMEKLPSNHKAKWFAGAALSTSEQAMASVLSTVLSKLNAFLDSELEQILCFDPELDAEKFCTEKSAIFLVLPEEDSTKYFMVSLFLQQFYREMLSVADQHGGKLPRRVMIYADEIGTIPKIQSFEMMLSAGRSRRISVVPIIQSFAQLQKNYGKEGSEIIVDNCQLTLFGGFAPNSESAKQLSQSLGTQTIMSGSVNRGKDTPSQSLQMMSRPLMTPDELKLLPKGQFIVTKTGANPMKTRLRLFLDWGIRLDCPYEATQRDNCTIEYVDKKTLVQHIISAQKPVEAAKEDPTQKPKSENKGSEEKRTYAKSRKQDLSQKGGCKNEQV